MTRIAGSLFLLAAGCASAADPALMNLVMPDAKVLAGLNAITAKTSPLGQFILSKVPGTSQQFQALVSATGFDPRQDVAEVLAASVGDPANPGVLVLLRGTFQPDMISAALTGKPGYTIGMYDGATLITSSNPKQKIPRGVAFIGNSIAVVGDLTSVKAALDRSTGNNSIDAALAAKVNALSTSEDAWFVSAVPDAALIPASTPTAKGPLAAIVPVLKTIQSSSGGVQLGSNVQITAEAVASDAPSAAALAAVLQLLKALAGSSQQLQNALPLIQQIQVTTNDDAVDLTLSIPESQIETLLNSLPKPQAKTDAAPPRPRRKRVPSQQN